MLKINEIFHSIQGEGVHAGRPATFIRLQGCSIGCPWCDTKRAWKEGGGTEMSIEDIVKEVKHPWVVLTGGEPTEQHIGPLIRSLQMPKHGIIHRVALETSGTNALVHPYPYWITLSPKLQLDFEFEPFYYDADEVKVVIDEAIMMMTVEVLYKSFIKQGKDPWFILMPKGEPPQRDMIEKALAFLKYVPNDWRWRWRIGPRLQYWLEVK